MTPLVQLEACWVLGAPPPSLVEAPLLWHVTQEGCHSATARSTPPPSVPAQGGCLRKGGGISGTFTFEGEQPCEGRWGIAEVLCS